MCPVHSVTYVPGRSMAHKNMVVRSINMAGELICVDIFRRPDGSYGFDQCRRDPEDGRGWFSVGHHVDRRFDSGEAALAAAKESVDWLADQLERKP